MISLGCLFQSDITTSLVICHKLVSVVFYCWNIAALLIVLKRFAHAIKWSAGLGQMLGKDSATWSRYIIQQWGTGKVSIMQWVIHSTYNTFLLLKLWNRCVFSKQHIIYIKYMRVCVSVCISTYAHTYITHHSVLQFFCCSLVAHHLQELLLSKTENKIGVVFFSSFEWICVVKLQFAPALMQWGNVL